MIPTADQGTPDRFTSRLIRAGVLSAALLYVGGGVAAAEPVGLADIVQSGDTIDGWHMSLSLTNSTINAVPNMAATAFTKEGFVTGKAVVTIDGDGKAPVNSGSLVLGVQLGCQINLDDGLDLGIGNSYDIIAEEPYLNLSPDISVTLKPGSIKTLGLGQKSLKGRTGVIFVRDAHVQVDGCGGPVSVRLFSSAMMSTDTSDDSLNSYGDVLSL